MMVYLVKQIKGDFNSFRRDAWRGWRDGDLTENQFKDCLLMLFSYSHDGQRPHRLASAYFLMGACNVWYEGEDAKDCKNWIRRHRTDDIDYDYFAEY